MHAQSLNVKPQLATANGLASRQGNGAGQQTRTAQATSGNKQSISSAKPYQASSTTPITVGGRTVNVFVSTLPLPCSLCTPSPNCQGLFTKLITAGSQNVNVPG